jgi:hypothetical protein
MKDLNRIREYMNEFLEVSDRLASVSPPNSIVTASAAAATPVYVEAHLINNPTTHPTILKPSEMVIPQDHS